MTTTSRRTLGQVVVCLGCCCGRTDKGHPPVPVDWLKQEWRRRMLPKHIHLTISGCLGPCDASNVVALHLGAETVWLGGVQASEEYKAIADWASRCAASGSLQALPAILEPLRMERFVLNPERIEVETHA